MAAHRAGRGEPEGRGMGGAPHQRQDRDGGRAGVRVAGEGDPAAGLIMSEPAAVAIESFGLTDTGKVRSGNEDQFVVASLRKSVKLRHSSLSDPDVIDRLSGLEAQLFVVADGVGGRPGGELASTTAVTTLLEYVDEAVACYHSLAVDQE